MQSRIDTSLDAIGDGLRTIWRDVVASPLPGRIGRLLEELSRREREVQRGNPRTAITAPTRMTHGGNHPHDSRGEQVTRTLGGGGGYPLHTLRKRPLQSRRERTRP
jgi:hypothetical protein